jgi:hypothetical protein
MKYHSQKTYTWLKLGTSNQTIASVGCYMTSFSNLLLHLGVKDISPDLLNTYLVKNGGFVNGNMFNSEKCAALFGMTYKKVTKLSGIKYPEVVICETDHYRKSGYSQHFFMYRPKDKMRIDPLDKIPAWEKNDYNIVSYRIFYPGILVEPEKPQILVPKMPETRGASVETMIARPDIVSDTSKMSSDEDLVEVPSTILKQEGWPIPEKTMFEKLLETIIAWFKKNRT